MKFPFPYFLGITSFVLELCKTKKLEEFKDGSRNQGILGPKNMAVNILAFHFGPFLYKLQKQPL